MIDNKIINILKQKPYKDEISRQVVIDTIDKWVKNMGVLTAFPANKITPLFETVYELPSVNSQESKTVLEDIKAEIKEWYWQADKQAIAKDPCVVDAMIDLFIRTIDAHISGEPQESEE